MEMQPAVAFWCWTGIQVVGIATAWLARVSERSSFQIFYQALFLTMLLVAGGVTAGAAIFGPVPCLISGASLAVMVLAATWDFSSGRQVLAAVASRG